MAERPQIGDPYLFSRKFKELVAGEQQGEVAVRMGYTQSRVSQVMRGEKPSREFVERLIEAYELPRDEWLALGGHGPQKEGSSDPSEERIARRVAQLLGEKIEPSLEVALGVVADAAEAGKLDPVYEPVEEAEGRQSTGGTHHSPKAQEALDRLRRSLAAKRHPKQ